jgi:hypothetical protein
VITYQFVKETVQFLIQVGTLLTLVSPLIWAVWAKLSKFVRDHDQIMHDFQNVTSDIKEMKDEFHNLNKAFRDYSEATDKRLIRLEQLNGHHHHDN